MQYTDFFFVVVVVQMNISLEENDIFFIFAPNIDCGYTLEPPRFWSKIRKMRLPLNIPVFYIKVGFMNVYVARTCFPDGHLIYVH